MAFAIVSDVHSNLEALTEVFADIDRQGIRDVVCLGDVVGYGPNPLECTDMIMQRCKLTLKGNHDEALVHGAYAFHLKARKAIDWTRDQLKPRFFSGTAVRRRWEFLRDLPARHEDGAHLFIHGSPRDPTNDHRSCYATVDGDTIEWHRVKYDFEKTIAKIDKIHELDPALGARLKEGM